MDINQLQLETSDSKTSGGGGGSKDTYLLNEGTFEAVLDSVKVEQKTQYGKPDLEEVVLIIGFKTVDPLDADDAETGQEENIGKHGILSAWLTLKMEFERKDGSGKFWASRGYEFNVPIGEQTNALTMFLDAMFGRKLTKAEVESLNFDKMKGLRGRLNVGRSKTGKGKVSSFKPPKKTVWEPSEFFRGADVQAVRASDFAAARQEPRNGNSPAPRVQVPIPTGNGADIDDPFAGE